MILSHEKKFIYIHIYKVAGISIRKVLGKYDDWSPRDFSLIDNIRFRLGARYPFLSSGAINHIKAREVKARISPEVFNSYFKFSFVRNPWDLQVSLFHFMREDANHPQHKLISKMKNFEEYIEWRVRNDMELQKDFLFDKKGNNLVDFTGKFENLQSDFDIVCDRIGVKRASLPHLNPTDHRNYREYYNEHTKKLIADAFREDIELFKYDF